MGRPLGALRAEGACRHGSLRREGSSDVPGVGEVEGAISTTSDLMGAATRRAGVDADVLSALQREHVRALGRLDTGGRGSAYGAVKRSTSTRSGSS